MEGPPAPPSSNSETLISRALIKEEEEDARTIPYPLPTPSQVRLFAEQEGKHPPAANQTSVLHFPDLNLRVKYGCLDVLGEGETMKMVQKHLQGRVPIPLVYDCLKDGGQGFVYMENIEGPTLQEEWPHMTRGEKESICKGLKNIIGIIREIRQYSKRPFVGNVNHTPITDIFLEDFPDRGPYPSVKSFHDTIAARVNRFAKDASNVFDPMRSELDDSSDIVFTHNDLHLSNIIVSPHEEGEPVIRAVIDWYQSGWYPDYWEYCKLVTTANSKGKWDEQYVNQILEPPESYEGWMFYMDCLG